MWIKVAVIASFICLVCCRSSYRSRMPNGYSVPNPCGTSSVWEPVGHFNPFHHTRLKNSFSKDFIAKDQSWAAICNLDSDMDGMSNGAELGDPNCIWSAGETPEGPAIGHPGICEPVGSSTCAWQKFGCGCLEHCSGLVGYP